MCSQDMSFCSVDILLCIRLRHRNDSSMFSIGVFLHARAIECL